MIISIEYKTHYTFSNQVPRLIQQIKLYPTDCNSQKVLEVDKVNPDSETNPVIDYVVRMEVETEMTRSQLENEIEPDYKILKIKEK